MPSIRNLIDFYDNDEENSTKSYMFPHASTQDLSGPREILRYMRTKSSPIGLSPQCKENNKVNSDCEVENANRAYNNFQSNVQRLRGLFNSKTPLKKEQQPNDASEKIEKKNHNLKTAAINVNVNSYVNLHASQPIYIPNITRDNGSEFISTNGIFRSTLSLTNRESTASNRSLNTPDTGASALSPISRNFEGSPQKTNMHGDVRTFQIVKNIPISKTKVYPSKNENVNIIKDMHQTSDFITPSVRYNGIKQPINRNEMENMRVISKPKQYGICSKLNEGTNDKIRFVTSSEAKPKRRFRRRSIKRSKSIDLCLLRPTSIRPESSESSSEDEQWVEPIRLPRSKMTTKRELYKLVNNYDSDDSVCGIPKPMHKYKNF